MPKRSPASSPARLSKLPKMDDSIDLPTATTGKESIPSYRPDANERRYDRQLRLWASSGQRSLEQANVLLVGCDATGCQALKNLVLPGISTFTILSDAIVKPKDVATNFFLSSESLGGSLADESVRYLCELNPSVTGRSEKKNLAATLQTDPGFFTSFSLIIASNLSPQEEQSLADTLWETSSSTAGPDIPVILVRNSGFIGRVEVQVREHCVVDTHPDNTHTLRIDKPFSALKDYAENLELDTMDSMDHSHVPWVVLLVRAASIWKASHDGNVPQDRSDDSGPDEHKQFKALLNSMRSKSDEENFDEAIAQAYQVWAETTISPELQSLLEDPSVVNVSKDSKNVHVLLAALRLYLVDHSLPPVAPTLPDMHSSTDSYLALQGLYRTQYQHDLRDFRDCLSRVLSDIGLPKDSIVANEVEGFVKNTNGVAVIKGSSIASRRIVGAELQSEIDDNYGLDGWPVTFGLPLHLAFMASDRFYQKHGRWPGVDPVSYEADISATSAELASLVKHSSELPTEVTQCVQEIVRGGFSTLPTTAALLGGIAAQEAIKLVTSQYAPLDNTCVVDLVHSTTSKWKF